MIHYCKLTLPFCGNEDPFIRSTRGIKKMFRHTGAKSSYDYSIKIKDLLETKENKHKHKALIYFSLFQQLWYFLP